MSTEQYAQRKLSIHAAKSILASCALVAVGYIVYQLKLITFPLEFLLSFQFSAESPATLLVLLKTVVIIALLLLCRRTGLRTLKGFLASPVVSLREQADEKLYVAGLHCAEKSVVFHCMQAVRDVLLADSSSSGAEERAELINDSGVKLKDVRKNVEMREGRRKVHEVS